MLDLARKARDIAAQHLKPELQRIGLRRHSAGKWYKDEGDAVWSLSYEYGDDWNLISDENDLSITAGVGYRSLERITRKVPEALLFGGRDLEVPVAVVAVLRWLQPNWNETSPTDWKIREETNAEECGREIANCVRRAAIPFWQKFTCFPEVAPLLALPCEQRPPYITTMVLMKYAAYEWVQGENASALSRLQGAVDPSRPIESEHIQAFHDWLAAQACGSTDAVN